MISFKANFPYLVTESPKRVQESLGPDAFKRRESEESKDKAIFALSKDNDFGQMVLEEPSFQH
jgi:hypothetical protein